MLASFGDPTAQRDRLTDVLRAQLSTGVCSQCCCRMVVRHGVRPFQ